MPYTRIALKNKSLLSLCHGHTNRLAAPINQTTAFIPITQKWRKLLRTLNQKPLRDP